MSSNFCCITIKGVPTLCYFRLVTSAEALLFFPLFEAIKNLAFFHLALLRPLPESYFEEVAYSPLHNSRVSLELLPLCPYPWPLSYTLGFQRYISRHLSKTVSSSGHCNLCNYRELGKCQQTLDHTHFNEWLRQQAYLYANYGSREITVVKMEPLFTLSQGFYLHSWSNIEMIKYILECLKKY